MDDRQARRTYLVVLGDYLVLRDIADTIAQHDSGATIIAATEAEAALREIERVRELEVAFIEAGPADFAGSDLAHAIRARAGRVVLLGDEAEEASGRFDLPVLVRPFRTLDVLRYLRAGLI